MAFSVWAFSQAASPRRCRRCPNFHLFFLALTVCPYDDGWSIWIPPPWLTNTTFPSLIIIVCGVRVAETFTRKSIDTHYEQPTSPLRPTATGRAEGAFFVSDFSRASKRNRGDATTQRQKGSLPTSVLDSTQPASVCIAWIYLRHVDTHEYTITPSSLSRLLRAAPTHPPERSTTPFH